MIARPIRPPYLRSLADLLSECAVELANLDGPRNAVARKCRALLRRLDYPEDVLDLNYAYGPRFRAVIQTDNEQRVLYVMDYGPEGELWPVWQRDCLVGERPIEAVRLARTWIEERLG